MNFNYVTDLNTILENMIALSIFIIYVINKYNFNDQLEISVCIDSILKKIIDANKKGIKILDVSQIEYERNRNTKQKSLR